MNDEIVTPTAWSPKEPSRGHTLIQHPIGEDGIETPCVISRERRPDVSLFNISYSSEFPGLHSSLPVLRLHSSYSFPLRAM
jgi:hypothetical protein